MVQLLLCRLSALGLRHKEEEPRIEDTLDTLGDSKLFSTLDLKVEFEPNGKKENVLL